MIALLAALALASQTPPEDRDCDDAMNQSELNFCAARNFEKADAELNRQFRAVITELRADGFDYDDGRQSGEQKLREAQRAWIIFRDAHCTLEAYESRGGSMEPMLYNGCRARITRERIVQLRPTPSER